MGKPNFSFQKRQKEIAKKKKLEEKKQRKLDKKAEQSPEGHTAAGVGEETGGPESAERASERG